MMANLMFPTILAFLLGLSFVSAQFTVVIDTLADLEAVGEPGTCVNYYEDSNDVCKPEGLPPTTSNQGFWSSCGEHNCEMKIRLGRLVGNAAVPSQIEILSYVEGLTSEIMVRCKVTPDGGYRNLDVIRNTGDWNTTVVTLDPLLSLTSDSEIYIRLVSSPLYSDVDILDRITFIYSYTTTTAPTTTTTTTTTTEPPIPEDVVLESDDSMTPGWSIDCEYRMKHELFSSPCHMNVPIDSGSQIGFWSSCGKYCALTYSLAAVHAHVPTSIVVNSFVSGYATLDIWVRVKGVLKLVGTVKDTTWTDVTFSLAEFGLDLTSEILFEPSSTRYPNHVDIIDTITIKFT